MTDRQWIQIRSWHAVRLLSDRVGRTWTLCGRSTESTIVDRLPAGRSCESCLRILARAEDRP